MKYVARTLALILIILALAACLVRGLMTLIVGQLDVWIEALESES